MKRYPSSFEGAETAPAHCVALIEAAPASSGVVLDLGCGRAPLAEPVRELGFDYVGVDVDADALAEVRERGFETHQVDLGAAEEELGAALRDVVAGRPLAAIVAADLVEHLAHPDALLRALRSLEGADSLIVSVPNVTHLNVGAKLLLGRWDSTEQGLLDDTHVRYFSEAALIRLFNASGWRQADEADTQNPDSPDQLFPPDAPPLRPGTPVRDLLRRLRDGSEPNGSTYQFVRRFEPGDVAGAPHRWAVEPTSRPRAKPTSRPSR
jgi:2-polyprenyl-3-methyl-5-hydroxy-6-metoxy-1,4-benzoquinol methylase